MDPYYYYFNKSLLPVDQQGDWQERSSNVFLWPIRVIHSQTIRVDSDEANPFLTIFEQTRDYSRSYFAATGVFLAAPIAIPSLCLGMTLRNCSQTYFLTLAAWKKTLQESRVEYDYIPPILVTFDSATHLQNKL
jgi:hypothetical protein